MATLGRDKTSSSARRRHTRYEANEPNSQSRKALMRIMFLGDSHADIRFMRNAIDYAVASRAEVIIQAGDFGHWDHVPAGVDYLDGTNAILERKNLWLIFVDGNHENFDSLYSIPVADDGFRYVRDRVLHAPRGHIWSIDDVWFLAFGGASSVDGPDGPDWWAQTRDVGQGWWPQERITDGDARRAMEATRYAEVPIDVMVTHDCPSGINIPGINRTYAAGEQSRDAVRAVMDHASPQLLVHGHYHRRSSGKLKRTRVEGLSSNEQTSGQVLLMETRPFTLIEDAFAQKARTERTAGAEARFLG